MAISLQSVLLGFTVGVLVGERATPKPGPRGKREPAGPRGHVGPPGPQGIAGGGPLGQPDSIPGVTFHPVPPAFGGPPRPSNFPE